MGMVSLVPREGVMGTWPSYFPLNLPTCLCRDYDLHTTPSTFPHVCAVIMTSILPPQPSYMSVPWLWPSYFPLNLPTWLCRDYDLHTSPSTFPHVCAVIIISILPPSTFIIPPQHSHTPKSGIFHVKINKWLSQNIFPPFYCIGNSTFFLLV